MSNKTICARAIYGIPGAFKYTISNGNGDAREATALSGSMVFGILEELEPGYKMLVKDMEVVDTRKAQL